MTGADRSGAACPAIRPGAGGGFRLGQRALREADLVRAEEEALTRPRVADQPHAEFGMLARHPVRGLAERRVVRDDGGDGRVSGGGPRTQVRGRRPTAARFMASQALLPFLACPAAVHHVCFTPNAREYLERVDNLRLEKPFDPRELWKMVAERPRGWSRFPCGPPAPRGVRARPGAQRPARRSPAVPDAGETPGPGAASRLRLEGGTATRARVPRARRAC